MNIEVKSTWIRTKSDEIALDQGCTFDIKAADKVRYFFEKFCRQSIGEWAGKPLVLLDWQWRDIIAPLYGWRKKDGSRRFRHAGIWVPKNNGKSTLCSGISIYELVGRGEPGAQVINLAATIEQAGIVFRSACDMVDQSPALAKHCWVRKNIKTIEFDQTKSLYRVMSGEGKGKHGFSISCLIFDELAEQSCRELWDTMRHNVGKRKNSVLISISTAGYRRESVGYEQFQYASKVLSGEIVDSSFLPVVYAAPQEADWQSLDTFQRANPSFGITIDPQEVQEALTEARNEPRKEAAYRTLRLNQWTGYATTWISSQAWADCGEDFQEQDLHGKDCWVGWDYSYKHDLASYCLIVPNNDKLYILPRFFIPKACAEKKEYTDHVPYRHWAAVPTYKLYLTDGDVIDPSFIRSKLAEDSEHFNFQEIGFDPTGLEESRQLCEQEHGWTMVSVPQRPRYLGGAAAFLERSVIGKTVRHPNNPVLNWCLENTAAKETPDGLHLFKGSGETQRIDGITATVIALSRYLAREDTAPQFWVFG